MMAPSGEKWLAVDESGLESPTTRFDLRQALCQLELQCLAIGCLKRGWARIAGRHFAIGSEILPSQIPHKNASRPSPFLL